MTTTDKIRNMELLAEARRRLATEGGRTMARDRWVTGLHVQRAEILAAEADELPIGSAERFDVLLSALVATQIAIMRHAADPPC